MISSASEFLALAKLKRGKVDVRGSQVNIREMNVAERGKFADLLAKNHVDAEVFLVRTCVTGEDGNPLFDDKQAKEISSSAPGVVDAVVSAVMKLSGLENDPKNA